MHQAEREERDQVMRSTSRMAGLARIGWLVFAALMVLVMLEYVVFLVLTQNLPIMVVMNLIDAGLIMYYFMHVPRLWRGRKGE